MTGFKLVLLAAVAGCFMMATAPKAAAQVAVEIGVAPDCPYGYYDVAPYDCAPYGYYGPEWCHVNNRLHPEHGYTGPKPQRGEKPEQTKHLDKIDHFKGNEVRDGRGHVSGSKK